jgi:hypothetical protein
MLVYISGPMSNLPDLNFPAFDEAKKFLTKRGFVVISPADLSRERSPMLYSEILRNNLKYLLICNAIFLLKGWGTSKGARMEYFVAENLGMRVIFQK